ncbi:hypothetical protein U9R71_22185 [Bacillus toyonensis]|uniref:hypothetical protein n=1 Tax=Bacillus toyonensis TaxID=155322 RepID=UPI00163AC377|nr:hypothetical protein [Bacillus toyonensis]MBC2684688.1 hypothetical protein [Bacillus toyonensis]MBH0359197.1 hypothetical protein [Bacillus toyonensis biovar Thuringiensis]
MSRKDLKGNIIGVREIDIALSPDDINSTEGDYGGFKCPYCGYEDSDAFELSDDEGEIECGECGSKVEYRREITINYYATPSKLNRPITI